MKLNELTRCAIQVLAEQNELMTLAPEEATSGWDFLMAVQLERRVPG